MTTSTSRAASFTSDGATVRRDKLSSSLRHSSLIGLASIAPVHSIAASLFLRPDQIHWFYSIGYRHEPFQNCPLPGFGTKCACSTSPDDPHNNFWNHGYSCTPRWRVRSFFVTLVAHRMLTRLAQAETDGMEGDDAVFTRLG